MMERYVIRERDNLFRTYFLWLDGGLFILHQGPIIAIAWMFKDFQKKDGQIIELVLMNPKTPYGLMILFSRKLYVSEELW